MLITFSNEFFPFPFFLFPTIEYPSSQSNFALVPPARTVLARYQSKLPYSHPQPQFQPSLPFPTQSTSPTPNSPPPPPPPNNTQPHQRDNGTQARRRRRPDLIHLSGWTSRSTTRTGYHWRYAQEHLRCGDGAGEPECFEGGGVRRGEWSFSYS